MSAPAIASSPLDRDVIRARVESALHEFLDSKAESAAARRLPADVVHSVRSFLFAGGRRLRSQFCTLGWYAGGGTGLPDEVVRAAAAMELFHAALLMHDDVIDDRDTRGDRPTVHRVVADRNHGVRGGQAAERLGARAAIVIGDLGLVWAQELLHTSGLSPDRIHVATTVLDAMRTEVGYGRYLELVTAGRPTCDLEQAWEIVRYSCAASMVEGPLRLGAVLADAGPAVLHALSAYAHPLGEAARLQDELSDVFGDARSGRTPTLRDLRDGRHTVLLVLALRHTTPAQRDRLTDFIANPRPTEGDAALCREILDTTARFEVERMIRDRRLQIHQVLTEAHFPSQAAAELDSIAEAILNREAPQR
ncbi:polyprenyl synthetase family protein [Nocardia sp. NPDC020380]|uniref:polyprenyl synthetase family protein n=1 Tax=Nocardia sp. NPDC020380 TaxID=3364309 RepID=UPI003793E47B